MFPNSFAQLRMMAAAPAINDLIVLVFALDVTKANKVTAVLGQSSVKTSKLTDSPESTFPFDIHAHKSLMAVIMAVTAIIV